MTEVDREVLGAIARFWRSHGYGPRYSDVVQRSGHALVTVTTSVERLRTRRMPLLRVDAGVARAMRLTRLGWQLSGVRHYCCLEGV